MRQHRFVEYAAKPSQKEEHVADGGKLLHSLVAVKSVDIASPITNKKSALLKGRSPIHRILRYSRGYATITPPPSDGRQHARAEPVRP